VEKTIESLEKLLRTCIEFFGPNLTLLLVFLIPLCFFAYRLYTDWVKRTEIDKVVAAKDETIQVMAQQNRDLRVQEFVRLGWTPDQIEAVVLKNSPKNALEARELFESTALKSDDEGNQ
jgi:hypothetical protein